ncbi:zinc finger MYM-type protein 6 [Octopus bimaculoides]|uniref:zinc finger MYM-type protein 6 n=1 Tax=Octopus bimaculoides TaxID=37653 RepID=UPI00071C528D|nr:zinc finger MYM-type protein 6 [Octopus bimaculoides]|eukprot:XP_014778847.1 PREDICTED: zinc finger MYM-type protein 6-like [Octopus bimaculoides]
MTAGNLRNYSNLETRHKSLQRSTIESEKCLEKSKPKAFFETKRHSLKQAELDGSGVFRQQTSIVVEASYEIIMLIAKSKESHNIGASLIKPNLLRAAELVLEKDSANKLFLVSLSNDTVNGRIDELFQDVKDQILNKVRDSPVFAIQCDEITDIAQYSQLLVSARFVSGNYIKEETFCHLFFMMYQTSFRKSNFRGIR